MIGVTLGDDSSAFQSGLGTALIAVGVGLVLATLLLYVPYHLKRRRERRRPRFY